MNTGIVASRYAKALLYFATQKGEAEMVYAEMQQLDRNFRELPALRNIPNNPVLDNAQKAAVITEAARLNDDSEVSNSTQRFIRLVVNKGRAELMQFIATSFLSAYEHEHHITRAYLTTAEAVAPEIRERMLRLVRNRTGNAVQLHVQTDPELKAGFILGYDDYRVDASLQGQLRQLRRRLN